MISECTVEKEKKKSQDKMRNMFAKIICRQENFLIV